MTRVPQWTGFGRKTLWDWLQLLIVPAILIGVTLVWSATQTRSDNTREDRRIAADRAPAEEARQAATLQAYLNEMSGLMLDKKLLTSTGDDAVRAVARTVTLTTLRRSDGARKAAALRFLYEGRLINGKAAVVSLQEADFRGAELKGASLGGANLERANFGGANLRSAIFSDADLDEANLSNANLAAAYLKGASIENADFRDAILREAIFDRASLVVTDLTGADLRGAQLVDTNLYFARLRGANLEAADLTSANLAGARLGGANLRFASLVGANLRSAIFSDADLENTYLARASLGDRKGADRHLARDLNLGDFIADLPSYEQEALLDSQATFLDSLSPVQLSKFNLSPEKLARFRREAGGG